MYFSDSEDINSIKFTYYMSDKLFHNFSKSNYLFLEKKDFEEWYKSLTLSER